MSSTLALVLALMLGCSKAPETSPATAPIAPLSAEMRYAAVIQRLHPLNRATGFKLGELRGAWRIDVPPASLGAGEVIGKRPGRTPEAPRDFSL